MKKDIYKAMEFDTGEHDGVIIDLGREQFVRIETEKDTGRSFVYVWNGIEEDHVAKIEIFNIREEDWNV